MEFLSTLYYNQRICFFYQEYDILVERYLGNRCLGVVYRHSNMIPSKLQRFRALLREKNLAAFIISSADAHQSEYVNARDKRREYISDFSGSAGTAVVFSKETSNCYLWTDGRYYTQAEKQLVSPWILMKDRLPETPTIEDFLATNLEIGAIIGIDPLYTSLASARRLQLRLEAAGMSLDSNASRENLVDMIWKTSDSDNLHLPSQNSSLSSDVVQIHPLKYAGISHADKIDNIRLALQTEGCESLVITSLDEIAWLFNIRGNNDIPCCPLAHSFAFVTVNNGVVLCIDEKRISHEVKEHLGPGIRISSYDAVLNEAILLPKGKVMVDATTCNFALFNAVKKTENEHIQREVVEKSSPIQLMKSKKNTVELDAIRAVHIRDGCAMVSFLSWLDAAVKLGVDQRYPLISDQSGFSPLNVSLTEYYVGTVLDSFRANVPHYISPSFETIAGYGPNGAIIHYRADPTSASILDKSAPFLLDSGGQYSDGGTTDVTRTLHFGEPTPRQKAAYTAVLKGHLALSAAKFPSGTSGIALDAVARSRLWEFGLDYAHGTGHGVGSFLNVHEGPQYIANAARSSYTGGLQESMTITNEPGYYEPGNFGIRIENVLIVRRVTSQNNGSFIPVDQISNNPSMSLDVLCSDKIFLEFENATFVPIATNLVDKSMMSQEEIAQLNKYNSQVRNNLAPYVREPALSYLIRETEPI